MERLRFWATVRAAVAVAVSVALIGATAGLAQAQETAGAGDIGGDAEPEARKTGGRIEFQMPTRSPDHPFFTITKSELEFYVAHPEYRSGVLRSAEPSVLDEMVEKYSQAPNLEVSLEGETMSRAKWTRRLALGYRLLGNKEYAEVAKSVILAYAQAMPGLGPFQFDASHGPWTATFYRLACAYDLLYEFFTPTERERVERDLFGAAAKRRIEGMFVAVAKPRTFLHNCYPFPLAFCMLAGLLTGDREMVDTVLNNPHFGFRAYIGCLDDVGFWPEGPGYNLMTLRGLFWIVELARRNCDADLYDYEVNGTTLARMLETYEMMAYPGRSEFPTIQDCGYGGERFAWASSYFKACFWARDRSRYAHFRDYLSADDLAKSAGYAYYDRVPPVEVARILAEGVEPDGAEPLRSVHLPWAGICVVRSDEPPGTQKYLLLNYGRPGSERDTLVRPELKGKKWWHEHPADMSIIYYDNGQLLAPDCGTPPYSDPRCWWVASTIGHNTVVVDQRPQTKKLGILVPPQDRGRLRFMHDGEVVKVAQASNAMCNEAVRMTRTLAMTNEYFIDVFQLESDQTRVYDWTYHGFGQLEMNSPMKALEEPLGLSTRHAVENHRHGYGFLADPRDCTTDQAWCADFFFRGQTVRLRMMAGKATQLIAGRGPAYVMAGDKDADMRDAAVVIARRETDGTRFVAVVEAFKDAPRVTSAGLLFGHDEHLSGVKVRGDAFVDYFLCASRSVGEQTLAASDDQGASMAFDTDARPPFGFVRLRPGEKAAYVCGTIESFRLRAHDGKRWIVCAEP